MLCTKIYCILIKKKNNFKINSTSGDTRSYINFIISNGTASILLHFQIVDQI